MFDNVGGKIKGVAMATFILELAAFVILGLLILAQENLYGLLFLLLGPVIAWLSVLLLYGFGQLIENSDIIAEEYKRKNEKHEAIENKNKERKQVQQRKKVAAVIANVQTDDEEFVDITCPNCFVDLSFTKEQLQKSEGLTCPMCDVPLSF